MTPHELTIYRKRAENFVQRLPYDIIPKYVGLEAEFCHSIDPVPFKNRLNGEYRPIKEGEKWGSTWDSAWFHLKGQIPREWKGKSVIAQLDFNGEALVFSDEGVPLQGLTNGSQFVWGFCRDRYPITDKCEGGEEVELWVEAAANVLFGVNSTSNPTFERHLEFGKEDPRRYGEHSGTVNKIRLCVFNEELWQLRLDVETLMHLGNVLPDESVRCRRIFRCLFEAIEVYADHPENVGVAREVVKRELSHPATSSDLEAHAVGHAHIDTGWLWPVRETIRKCARTFSSQIALIKRYPGYVFGASQPQHYAFVKEYYPKLYEKIAKCIQDGTWEVQGGFWVEADCNIISGESMIRQLLHGKNFFMDEFRVDVKNLWLPDVFGYSAAMPQILKKSGIDYFVTQKISWNQFNEFPHTTFMWEGIDGTEILTHFPPENNYNSQLLPQNLLTGRKNFKENDFVHGFLSLFGVGDGGGGPKAEYLEFGRRQANLEGAPKVVFSKAEDFLASLDPYVDRLPRWVGELYLELHRGTLTTQAQVKRYNRELERTLRQIEAVYCCLPLVDYPHEELDHIWKAVLINQFHDIIPGSSITKVYQDTHREYEEALDQCRQLLASASEKLFEQDANSLVLFNALSYTNDDPVVLPDSWNGFAVVDEAGNDLEVQQEDGRSVLRVSIPPYGKISLQKREKLDAKPAVANAGKRILENSLIRYTFNEDGTISSIFDKEIDAEILAEGDRGNLLSLYEDRPNNWDAWDIDIFYEKHCLETAKGIENAVICSGSVRQGLFLKLAVGNSTIEQQVFLNAGSKRLDFRTKVEWNEKHRMLRVSFPVDIRNEEATFDIQYGYIKRPTHRNTSWDMAKFEVAAHRYADLSESHYGVALLNNCKYGHKVLGNVLDLNLLRSPTSPDPDADEGTHEFTYSILPHKEDLIHSNVFSEAAKLNMPALVFEGCKDSRGDNVPCRLTSDGIAIEAVKKAEKEDCIVVRLVETLGNHSTGILETHEGITEVVETDLMEWNDANRTSCTEPIRFKMTPFEIKTLKLKR